jgi:hypothetical protein
MACDGRRYRCEIPVFTRSEGMSSTATVVASEPVPHVVGIARCGFNGPGTGAPDPTGALTYDMTGAGCETIRFATFAVSIDEPPPSDTNPSTSHDSAKSAAACSDSSVGSTRDWAYTTTEMPASRSEPDTVSTHGIPGSVTSRARDTPSRDSSNPASATAPGPNLIGVASRVKIVSEEAISAR